MTRVEILACGSADRGDDGAALLAAAMLAAGLPDDVRLRVVGQLEVDDLLELPAEATVVVVDTAIGIQPGRIVSVPLEQVTADPSSIRPRSSHTLAFADVLGLAGLIRGRPIEGRLVAIGGSDFSLGGSLSERVRAAIPALVAVIRTSIDQAWIGHPVRVGK